MWLVSAGLAEISQLDVPVVSPRSDQCAAVLTEEVEREVTAPEAGQEKGGGAADPAAGKSEQKAPTSEAVEDSQPSKPPTDSQPSKPTTDSQPSEPATDSQPSKPATDSQPSKPATDSQPSKPATDSQPSEPATDSQPSEPATDSQPSKPATASQPSEPAADSKEDDVTPSEAPVSATEVCQASGNTQVASSQDDKTSKASTDTGAVGCSTKEEGPEAEQASATPDTKGADTTTGPAQGLGTSDGVSQATESSQPSSKDVGAAAQKADVTGKQAATKDSGSVQPTAGKAKGTESGVSDLPVVR